MKPPLRVAMVTQAVEGGVADYITQVVHELPPERFHVEILAPAHPAFMQRFAGRCPYIPIPIERALNPLHDARAMIHLVRVLASKRYDIIHLHSSKAGAVGRLAALASRNSTKVIYSPHCFAFLDPTNSTRGNMFGFIERTLAPLAKKIVCVSEGERIAALQWRIGSPDRLMTICNGIDPQRYRPLSWHDRAELRRSLGISDSEIVVGTVGRMAVQKGHSYLMEAASQVLRARQDVRFIFVGDGPLRDELRALAERLGISPHTLFLGQRQDVDRLLSAFDIFALPSLWEGLALSLLQAMAVEVPVIASRVTGNEEVIDSAACGMLVPPAASNPLSQAILELAGDKEQRIVMGRRGRDAILQRYNTEAMLQQLQTLYADVAL